MTSSTKSSSGDELCVGSMKENIVINKSSNSGHCTTGEGIDDQLSIDPSTGNQNLHEPSYIINKNCKLDLNRYKFQSQSSQISVSITQSSIYTTDNTHLMELKARKRKMEKKFQVPPRLVIMRGAI